MNRLYEGMFLLDANETARRWSEMESHIGSLLNRVDAKLQYAERWPDQRLAYEVKGAKKGTYYLTYFLASPERIQELRRDAELSEHVLRLLVIQEDWLETEMTQRQEAAQRRAEATPAAEETPAEAPTSESAPPETPAAPATAPESAPTEAAAPETAATGNTEEETEATDATEEETEATEKRPAPDEAARPDHA